MADILHDFTIAAPSRRVFEAMTSPAGLDSWWTKSSSGRPAEGAEYELDFGPGYEWRAVVRQVVPERELEWEITEADQDWTGTRVGFRLEESGDATQVWFRHTGWAAASGHHRASAYCWAMYLRLLKRYLERGEVVPYGRRSDA